VSHNASDGDAVQFTRKGLATRARIVDTAAQLMFRHGVTGTSIDEVRSAGSISGSQIAHYFHDKRDLTRQVIAARRNDVMAFHTQQPLGRLDTFEALQAWADAGVADAEAVYRKGGCVFGSLTGELLEADDDVRGDLAVGYDQWLDLFRVGLTAMRDRADLSPDADPRHLAVALVAAHQGGAMLTYATGSSEPFRAAVNAAVAYVRSFAPTARSTRATSRRKHKP
jgi:AcrR family transcriptional regulator